MVRGSVEVGGELLWCDDPSSGFSCWRQEETIVLAWPEARFRVTDRQVVVDASHDDHAMDFLLQPTWSVVLAAHGRESFHAAAVESGGNGLAVFGWSGVGKSTSSLLLVERGWRLITDDLLVFDEQGRAIPGPPLIRLLPDRAVGKRGRVDSAGKLRFFPTACHHPVPLAAGVVLSEDYSELTRLSGISAVNALLEHVYNPVVTHPAQAEHRLEVILGLVEHTPIFGAPPRSLTADQLEDLTGSATT